MRDPRPSPSLPPWLPGTLLLLMAAVVGIGAGFLLGARSWTLYLGLMLGTLLGMGAVERMLAWHGTPSSPRLRRRLKVIQGGKAYDLSKDDSTDNQRYLM